MTETFQFLCVANKKRLRTTGLRYRQILQALLQVVKIRENDIHTKIKGKQVTFYIIYLLIQNSNSFSILTKQHTVKKCVKQMMTNLFFCFQWNQTSINNVLRKYYTENTICFIQNVKSQKYFFAQFDDAFALPQFCCKWILVG